MSCTLRVVLRGIRRNGRSGSSGEGGGVALGRRGMCGDGSGPVKPHGDGVRQAEAMSSEELEELSVFKARNPRL
jgi:hypothetical protein